MSEIAFHQYGGPPRIPAVYAKPLVRLMQNQAPADLDRQERELLDDAEQLAEQIEVVLKQRDGAGGIRAAFLDFVNGWSATHGALDAIRRIPASVSPKGARAAKLLATAFPDDLSFTRLPAAQAWAYGDRLASRLHESGLDQQIDDLVGPDCLRAARKVTAALGETLGVGRTPIEIPDPTAVQSLLAKFQRAVARYSRVMLAKVDDESAPSVERFRKAVAIPIDRYRSTRATRDDGDLDPEQPAPPETPALDPVVEPEDPAAPAS